MKSLKYILMLLSFSFVQTACMKPRVDFDPTVYGDHAVITNVQMFRYVPVTNQLGYNEAVDGYQLAVITTTTNTIDKPGATVNYVAAKGTDLTKIAIRFSHEAKKIEPVADAPTPGIIADFSRGRYQYKLVSADGTERVWTINISVAP